MKGNWYLLLPVCVVLALVSVQLIGLPHASAQGNPPLPADIEPPPPSDWPQQGYGPQRSSFNPNEQRLGAYNAGSLVPVWEHEVSEYIAVGLTAANGMIYLDYYYYYWDKKAGTFKLYGGLTALDAGSGQEVWTRGGDNLVTGHAVLNSIVYVSSRCVSGYCGEVTALQASNGTPIWKWNSQDFKIVDILVLSDIVYATTQDQYGNLGIQALSAGSGSELWDDSQGGLLAANNGQLYISMLSPSSLRVVDAAGGALLWTGLLEGDNLSRPAAAGDYVYVHSSNGKIYAFDSEGCENDSCSPAWVALVPGGSDAYPQAPALAYGMLYVGGADGFFAFDASGCGEDECGPVWRAAGECASFSGVARSPSVANGVIVSNVICPEVSQLLYVFDTSNGELIWSDYNSGVPPIIAGGRLFYTIHYVFIDDDLGWDRYWNVVYAREPPYVPVYLSPESGSLDALPGEQIVHQVTLRNFTGQTDSFHIEISGNDWPSALSESETELLLNGENQTFTLTVDVPSGAAWYATDTVNIRATSNTYPELYTAAAQLVTRVYAPPQITVSPSSLSSTQYINQAASQTLSVGNGMGIPLNYAIFTTPAHYGVDLQLHLDEPAGSTVFKDSSGGFNHGYCYTTHCPAAGAPGYFGSGAIFDGVDDYIWHQDLVMSQPEGTISLWFKVYSLPTEIDGKFFWSGAQAPPGSPDRQDWMNLGIDPSYGGNQIMFGIYADDWRWAKSGVIPDPGEWYHLAATWGSGGMKIYVDGALKGTNSYTGPAPASVLYDLIGSSSLPSTSINGMIDEVNLYQRALTEQEIGMLYQSGIEGAWLSISPGSGLVSTESSAAVQAGFDSSGMAPGEYTANLFVTSDDPENPNIVVPVTMTIMEFTEKRYLPVILQTVIQTR